MEERESQERKQRKGKEHKHGEKRKRREEDERKHNEEHKKRRDREREKYREKELGSSKERERHKERHREREQEDQKERREKEKEKEKEENRKHSKTEKRGDKERDEHENNNRHEKQEKNREGQYSSNSKNESRKSKWDQPGNPNSDASAVDPQPQSQKYNTAPTGAPIPGGKTVEEKRKLLWSSKKTEEPDLKAVGGTNQWHQVSFGDKETKSKFLKLMGAGKIVKDAPDSLAQEDETRKKKEEQMLKDLEKSFSDGIDKNVRKTTGLGF